MTIGQHVILSTDQEVTVTGIWGSSIQVEVAWQTYVWLPKDAVREIGDNDEEVAYG